MKLMRIKLCIKNIYFELGNVGAINIGGGGGVWFPFPITCNRVMNFEYAL